MLVAYILIVLVSFRHPSGHLWVFRPFLGVHLVDVVTIAVRELDVFVELHAFWLNERFLLWERDFPFWAANPLALGMQSLQRPA